MNNRMICHQVLTDITEHGAYANLRLKRLPEQLPDRDKRWITALTYTTLDHLLYIDYLIKHYTRGSVKPAIRTVLRMGIGELLFFGTPAHAAISESVKLTQSLGKSALSGFVNAVLHSIDREREHPPKLPDDPVEQLSIQYSYPVWLVREWCGQYGDAFAEQMLVAQNAKMEVRAQYPETTENLLKEFPVPATRGRYDKNCLTLSQGLDVTHFPAYTEGRMNVQSESAMLVCRALGNCTGMCILDACAAPGGKAAYLASLCQNNVHLTCMELHEHRKALLDNTLARLHVNAETLQQDATELIPALCEAFDAVLLDAPCSGLGLTGDKPDVRYSKTDADVAALAQLQHKLLCTCADYVCPGGILVYATCTISRRENEANVSRFLAEHPAFTIEKMPLPIENNGMLQLFPHVHGTDGFFIARMRKCS